MLTLESKKAVVAEVAEVAKNAISVVAADYRGLTVADMTDLRAKARDAGIVLRVVRNTLSRRALKDTQFECLSDSLSGQLFLAFSLESPSSAARVLRDFAKSNKALEIRALSISGKVLGPDQLEKVAKLPNREEALSQLLFVMKEPITKLARVLNEPTAKLVRTIAAVRDQKQAG